MPELPGAIAAQPAAQPDAATAVLHALPRFGQVLLERHGRRQACSLKTALYELRRSPCNLADLILVDHTGDRLGVDSPCSAQGRALVEAVLAAGLPDRTFDAAKGRR